MWVRLVGALVCVVRLLVCVVRTVWVRVCGVRTFWTEIGMWWCYFGVFRPRGCLVWGG